VVADLLPQDMPDLAQVDAWHPQAARQRLLPRRDDQRIVTLPGEPADVGVSS
jgi:hypothetical protein